MNQLAIKAVAALALVATLITGYLGWRHHVFAQGEAATQARWDAAELQRAQADKAAILQREKDNAAAAKTNRETSRLIQKAHDDQISQLRTALAAAPRLRIGTALCGGPAGTAKTDSAAGSNGADTGGGLVREDLGRDIDALKLKVEEALAAGRAAQQFIRDNGFAP